MKLVVLFRDPKNPEINYPTIKFAGTDDDLYNALKQGGVSNLLAIRNPHFEAGSSAYPLEPSDFAISLGVQSDVLYQKLVATLNGAVPESNPNVITLSDGEFSLNTEYNDGIYTYNFVAAATPIVQFSLNNKTHQVEVYKAVGRILSVMNQFSNFLAGAEFPEPVEEPAQDVAPTEVPVPATEKPTTAESFFRNKKINYPVVYGFLIAVVGGSNPNPIEVLLKGSVNDSSKLDEGYMKTIAAYLKESGGMILPNQEQRNVIYIAPAMASNYESIFLSALKDHNLEGLYSLERREQQDRNPDIIYL